ncbi:uracil-DNA glycosylase family protein [Pedobacter sp. GR22-6]|uniref:uracil-DNA glycosylase family protein n=1 Tax=Pedobacter sp. GR22-6 TaxID=3127957 RepID=UPI00307EBC4E
MSTAVEFKERHFVYETHPYPDHINSDTKVLVIGTFPSHVKNAGFAFYYAGEGNMFWELLSVVFGYQFRKLKGEAAVKERKALLDTYHIGITDMVSTCYRYKGFSGDEYIFPVAIKDILGLLDQFPSIERLVFTSRTFIVGALGRFSSYLIERGLEMEDMGFDGDNLLRSALYYDSRKIDILVPISPSKRVQRDERFDFDEMVEMYKKSLR